MSLRSSLPVTGFLRRANRRRAGLVELLTPRRVDPAVAQAVRRCRPLVAAAMVLAGLVLSGCENTRPYEYSADGTVVYLDQLTPEQRVAARQKIVETLLRGLTSYQLQIGDEFEMFFAVARSPTRKPYVISVGDKLRIESLGETDNNRVVEVRPDGRVSLPLLGPVMAAGKTADALARELERLYAGKLTEPHFTVNVTQSHSPIEDFVEMVGQGPGRARSVISKVLPDGTISPPLLRPIKALGLTLPALQSRINAAYAHAGYTISVSLLARTLQVGMATVLGEVGKPGRIDADRPQTVLMMLAQAGGVLTTGSLEAVRVFYIAPDGVPRVRSVNLREVIEGLRLEEDMIVPRNSIIYVPPTELAKAGRFLDAVLRDILRFQGFSLTGNILINSQSGTAVVPAR